MSVEALLVLADGTDVRGRGHRRRPAGRRRHRRGRVQHRAVRLPGGHHRPVLRRADHHLHLPAHRQLRRDPGRRREPPARSAAGVVVRELARRRSNWRSRRRPRRASCAATASPGIAGVDTRRLTRHIRDAGAMPGAFGTAGPRPRCAGRGAAEPGTDGVDLVAPGHHRAEPLHGAGATGAAPRRRLRLRHQDDDPAPPRPSIGHRRGRAGVDPGRRRAGPSSPTACSSPTARATRRRSPYAARGASAALLGEVPVFGICLGHQLLGHRPRRRRRTSCPFGHHGGNHPVRGLATGAVEITSQNHNFGVDLDGVGRRRGHPRQPQRRRRRGHPLHRRAGLQRAVPPRGRPRPARRPLPVRSSSTTSWTGRGHIDDQR